MSDLFSPLQHDALCEIFNISVGRAAAAMNGFVGEEVSLSVPIMRMCPLESVGQRVGMNQWRHVDAVCQHFSGSFAGDAFLMFADEDGVALARMVTRRLPRWTQMQGREQLTDDALCEIGNILLNACMSALADLVDEEFDYSTAALRHGRAEDILAEQSPGEHGPALFLHIQFLLEEQRIEGYLIFLLSEASLEGLREGVDRFLDHLGASINH